MKNQTPHNFFSELFRDNYIRTIFKIVITLLLIFICVLTFKAIIGQHIKIFGIELNIPEEPIVKKSDNRDTTIAKITSVSNLVTLSKNSKPSISKPKGEDKSIPSPQISTEQVKI
jgi:hypothetical protein